MLKEKLKIIPEEPGCYLMKDIDGKIIYVGKAKNLKRRVNSYFIGSHNSKTTSLVSNICDFEFIITSSELESLILEMNLIKKHTPKYNIKLMDDKTYPYIAITDELNPKLVVTRKKTGKYIYGPYPDTKAARSTIDLLNKLYPLRKCHTIPKKECLYYHLNQCLAPCINKNKINYNEYIYKINKFLKGDTKEVLDDLENKMYEKSSELKFEEANEFKNMILSINKTVEKQKISQNDKVDRDILGFYYDQDDISIQIFFVRNGSINLTHKDVISYVNDPIDAVFNYIIQIYKDDYIFKRPNELVVDHMDNDLLKNILNINVFTPKKGDKKKLLDLAFLNAKTNLEQKRELIRNKEEKNKSQLESLEEVLNKKNIKRIEAFDNSNIFGTNAVSGMVVYKDGKKSYKDYRKFIIKSVNGPDDYKSMEEVIYRRYYRVLMENLEKPDLIIIDGGIGQVNAAKKVLDELYLDILIIGLKKNDFHKTETIVLSNGIEIPLSSKMPCYTLLANIQEEVHRYAISFHRSKRDKTIYSSIFDDIKGIGPKRKNMILKKFKSLEEIKNASYEDFKEINISLDLFNKIKEHLEY